jgi:hypothetical protein
MKIAARYNGAFLCDSVGLGKTFIGLMLIERLLLRVVNYSLKKTYGKLLDDLKLAFDKQKPLLSLAIYYPLAYYNMKEGT